jgi:two-component system nitrate/nitrite response regulator NarL
LNVNIMIVDDHEMFRKGISRLISQISWANVCAELGTLEDVVRLLKGVSPDIILLDLHMGKERSFHIIPKIRELNQHVKIVILTNSEDPEDIVTAAQYSVDGYLVKSMPFEQFEGCLHDIALGNIRITDYLGSILFKHMVLSIKNKNLTSREQDVYTLLSRGMSNKEIADQLNISLYTVKNHVSNIIKKHHLANRYQVMVDKHFNK